MDFPADLATFKVKRERLLRFFFQEASVFHNEDVNLHEAAPSLEGKHSIDASKKRVRIGAKVLGVVRFEELFQLVLIIGVHGLDDEAVVMGEKEEATTLTCTFSSLEDCRSIALNVKGLDEAIHGDVVSLKKLLELFFI